MTRTWPLALALSLGLAGCPGEPEPEPEPDQSGLLFDDSVVHQIEITVDAALLPELVPGSDLRVPGEFVFDGVALSQVGVRLKTGFGSQRDLSQKAGFNIKFDEFIPDQELFGIEKISLGNAVQDHSFIGEMISYELFRRAGIPAARTAYAEVRFNGELFGLYVIRESINKDFLRANFDDPDGNLYEGEFQNDVSNPPSLSLDTNEEQNDRSDIEALAQVLNETPDEDFLPAVDALVDLDKFFAFWAVEAALYHWDGYTVEATFDCCSPNNYYVYNDLAQGKFVFLPHGTDQAMGIQGADIGELEVPILRAPSDTAVLASRLFTQPGSQDRLLQATLDFLDSSWDVPELLARADALADLVRATGLTGSREEVTLDLFEAEFAERRRFLELRPSLIRSF